MDKHNAMMTPLAILVRGISKRVMTNVVFASGVLFCFVSPTYANDSIASVGAGGLVLEKTDDIQMVSEVLEISTKEIRVTYHFLNTSKSDIKTTVAFPMPAFHDSGNGDENEGPLTSFKMFANGVQVPVQVNRVFRIKGSDVTDKLRKLGLSDQQIFDPRFECFPAKESGEPKAFCKLERYQVLAIYGLGFKDYGDGEIQETAYWEQIFPAGKEIEVVHEYKPFTGRSYLNPAMNIDEESRRYDKKRLEGVFLNKHACMDAKTRKRVVDGVEKSDVRPALNTAVVEYILGTGRNWKGPINQFRLILKKDNPYQIVSLCFPGTPIRTSPTTIEFTHKDFVPQDELMVFFYRFGELDVTN